MPGVVVLAGPGESTWFLCNALDQEFGVSRVILEQPVPRAAFLWKRLKRHGAITVAGQLLFRALCTPYLRMSSRRRAQALRERFDLLGAPLDPSRVSRVSSVNSPETIALLRGLDPSVVVISGTRILSGDLLQAVSAPFLNIHAGITPLYRGVHGAYWALVSNDRARCGVTIHRVDEGIDTGTIASQQAIEPTPQDTFVTYPLLQLGAGLPLLKGVVAGALVGRLPEQHPPQGPSRLWTHPTLFQYLWFRIARGVR